MSKTTVPETCTPGKRRGASLKVYQFADDGPAASDPIVAGLVEYQNGAARDDKVAASGCPRYVYRTLQVLAATAERNMTDTIAYCLETGLQQLEGLPEWEIIRACRDTIDRVGPHSSEYARWERYDYRLTGDLKVGGGRLFGRVTRKVLEDAHKLGGVLDVSPPSAFILVAIVFGLHDARCFHPDDARLLGDEARHFLRELRRRAREIAQIRGRAVETPRPEAYTASLADLLADDGEGAD